MQIFNSILLFLDRFFQLRAVHPVNSVGRYIFAAGGIGGIVVSVSAVIQDTPLKIEVSTESGAFLSVSLIALGVLIMVAGALMTVASHRARIVYLQGLPFSPPNLADKVIGKPYSLHQPSRTTLRIPETTNTEDIISYINRDCEVAVRQISDDTGNAKVFFAGLARVPCLFIVGSFFRTCGIEVEPLERFRSPDRWGRLKFVANVDYPSIEFSDDIDKKVSADKELGIAISITSEVLVEELPEYIQSHTSTFKLKPSVKPEAFSTLPHVHDFSNEFKRVLDKACKKANVVHLFICAQSSVVFELGRKYQEGMHCKIVIHNFDPETSTYPWAFQISNGQSSLYHRDVM